MKPEATKHAMKLNQQNRLEVDPGWCFGRQGPMHLPTRISSPFRDFLIVFFFVFLFDFLGSIFDCLSFFFCFVFKCLVCFFGVQFVVFHEPGENKTFVFFAGLLVPAQVFGGLRRQ